MERNFYLTETIRDDKNEDIFSISCRKTAQDVGGEIFERPSCREQLKLERLFYESSSIICTDIELSYFLIDICRYVQPIGDSAETSMHALLA